MGVLDWSRALPITRSERLPPEPRFWDAVGHNHEFKTAVADLIDNSIDANARTVLARFIRTEGVVTSFVLVDDGSGIPADKIDNAMTLGGAKEYTEGSLGHFGVGLKASSFSQANTLVVMSRADHGTASGRQWILEKAHENFECDVIDQLAVEEALLHPWGSLSLKTGTVVLWKDMKTFPRSSDTRTVDSFLQSTIESLARHLGLVFHRILAAGRIRILIDSEDSDTGGTGAVMTVAPINPFGYTRSGLAGYPKNLTGAYAGREFSLECHIWPGRSQAAEFRLDGKHSAEDRQGFYFYRNDRLLQGGGWNQIVQPDREHQLARVAIDIDDSWAQHIGMNPQKSAVLVDADFLAAVEKTQSQDGVTFWGFLDQARETYKKSTKRNRDRPKTVPPGKGFHPEVRSALDEELDYLRNEDPFHIRWERVDGETFFEVDRTERVLRLNKRYRAILTGYERGTLNDAPILKALLYLLMQEVFAGSHLGPRDKDNIDLWQQILTAAAMAEEE